MQILLLDSAEYKRGDSIKEKEHPPPGPLHRNALCHEPEPKLLKTIFCEKVHSLYIFVRRKSATRESNPRSLGGHAMLPHHTKLGKVFSGMGAGGQVGRRHCRWAVLFMVFSVTNL